MLCPFLGTEKLDETSILYYDFEIWKKNVQTRAVHIEHKYTKNPWRMVCRSGQACVYSKLCIKEVMQSRWISATDNDFSAVDSDWRLKTL